MPLNEQDENSDSKKISLQYKNQNVQGGWTGMARKIFPCDRCRGTGKYGRNKYGRSPKCSACEGTGVIYMLDCPDCLATGFASDGTTCSTCKGEKLVSKVETDKIFKAREACEKFKQNPLKALVLPAICVIVIAVCAGRVWSGLFVDYELIWGSLVALPGTLLFLSFYLIYREFSKYFKGSTNHPDRGMFRTVGACILCAGILAALVSGFTADKYSWIENKTMSTINNRFLTNDSVKCTGVDFNTNEGNTYHGYAKFSNGESRPIVATYTSHSTQHGKHSLLSYRVNVEF